MKKKEIIIIDDDEDDREFFREALLQLNTGMHTIFFNDGTSAFEYLKKTKSHPFLILCDINMPGLNGFEFRELMVNDNNIAASPFVFISTSANPTMYRYATDLNIQGYFHKPASFNDLKELLDNIIKYWEASYTALSNSTSLAYHFKN